MAKPVAFPVRFTQLLPSELARALELGASQKLTTRSEYARSAILDQLSVTGSILARP